MNSSSPLAANVKTLLAAALIALGAIVTLGWAIQSSAMVRVVASSVAMGLNTALAFIAAGIWLISQRWQTLVWARIRRILALALIALFSLVVLEHILDVSLGIDWAELHRHIQDGNPRPGRVALNTSLAFILTGIVFLLVDTGKIAPRRLRAARVLAMLVFAIGVSGLLGYILALEWLYQWYRFNSMALPTAAGICVLAIALLLLLRKPVTDATRLLDADKKIVARSTAILALLAGAFALFGFILLRDGVESVIRRNLMQEAESHREMLFAAIEQHMRMARSVANRPGLLNSIAALQNNPADAAAADNIVAVQQSFLALGFARLEIYDRSGRLLTPPHAAAQAALAVPLLKQPIPTELVWSNGFVLRTRIALIKNAVAIGFATADQPLSSLTAALINPRGGGETGEHRLCARAGERLKCFPSKLDPLVREFPFFTAGKPTFPVARAILGENGVTLFRDYRKRAVLVAYVSIEPNSLGLVTKQDVQELFQPLRERLALLVGLIAALVLASGYILRSSVRPLASQLLRAESAARESAHALSESVAALKQTSENLRASESEIRTLNAELEERVKIRTSDLTRANEDLNQFAYAASHDLQEPLRNVSLYSQLMARRYTGKLDQDADTYLNFIAQSAQRMQQLLRDVLDYTQVATGKSAPLEHPNSAETALSQAIANLHTTIQQSGAQITHTPLPEVYVYQTHLVQLFQNLISNSIKYRSAAPPQIHIDAQQQSERWQFSVKDNGIGIEAQYMEQIFGVFKRLHKEAYPGTGIGLAICQKIVHRYHGKIWAESEFGKGTTFYFSLPGRPPLA